VFIGSASRSAFKEVGIDRDVLPPLLGNQRLLEDRRDGAGSFAGAALDTFIGIDRKMLRFLIPSDIRILRLTNCEKRSNVHHEPVLRIPETLGKGYGFIAHLLSAACALFACFLLTRKKRPLEVEKLDVILWMVYYGLNESVIERREV
jgi:hypothetical protein